jgi:hypothetical protein
MTNQGNPVTPDLPSAENTKVLGYHPILATRADTGEILHARLRKGSANTQRGTKRFVEELVARLRRAGATGKIIIRFDSGYWNNDTLKAVQRLGVSFTMAVRTGTKAVDAAISKIDESTWVAIEYPAGGEAMVAECTYKRRRLIVRRTRLRGPQATLWPNWRHFAFLSDLEGTAIELDAFHRATPSSSCASTTGRRGRAWSTALQVTSGPTRRGCAVLSWPTT